MKKEHSSKKNILSDLRNLLPTGGNKEVCDTNNEEDDEPAVEVEVGPLWSLFKYLYKPVEPGLEDIAKDDRLYFTIPLGFVLDTMNYHYFTFPAGGTDDDITEFFYKKNLQDDVYGEE